MSWRVRLTMAALLLAAARFAAAPLASGWAEGESAVTTLYNQAGDPVGTVHFTQLEDRVVVEASVRGLAAGYHGFHIHTVGECDADSTFASAGGHLDLPMEGMAEMAKMGHTGDLTNLYVNANGSGTLVLSVDKFRVADLLDDGGRSIVVHADPDNFRNIPSRYGVTPDQATLDTGDAGSRIACGVIEPA